jgi:thioesterase domain-containing protein
VRILRQYRPQRYDGSVVLLRARTVAFPRKLGWDSETVPNLSVQELPGDHEGMMRLPYVSVLASELQDAILQAERRLSRGDYA